MANVNKNKFVLPQSEHATFAREYMKRKVLWNRNASFVDKTEALVSLAAALGVCVNPRVLYTYCIKFRKSHEKKVRSYLIQAIEKNFPPELALKRPGVIGWVREVDAELQVLPKVIQQCRLTGELALEEKSQIVWTIFVYKLIEHCHKVKRLPDPEDIQAVVTELRLNNSVEVFQKLWTQQKRISLYKYRCLSHTGDKFLESFAMTQLEWRIVDLMALYVAGFSLIYDGTFRSNVQVKQLVKLCYLVKVYGVEETGTDEQMRQKWAMVVRTYSRKDDTSPSGIVLQMRWHELKQLTRKNILDRLKDRTHKVHPLMVEIATKYPHILKDSDTWAQKVTSGKVYDVLKVSIQGDCQTDGEEQEERANIEQDKNVDAGSDFDSDDDRPLVIAENKPTTSNIHTTLTESNMLSLHRFKEPIKSNNEVIANKAVVNLKNEEVAKLGDELSTNLDSTMSYSESQLNDNISNIYFDAPPVTETREDNNKYDILDAELEKLEEKLNEQLIALKKIHLRTTDTNHDNHVLSTDNKDIDSKLETLAIKILDNDNVVKMKPESSKEKHAHHSAKSNANIKKYGAKKLHSTKHSSGHENHSKFANKKSKTNKDEINIDSEPKSELTIGKVWPGGVISSVYTCNHPNRSDSDHASTQNSKNTFKITIEAKNGLLHVNTNIANDPMTSNCPDVSKDDPLISSKESDIDLLQKIDPTQAETVLIFSDSDIEDDKVLKKDQDEKKTYNLNDVKKYLNNHSLDDILMKMDNINVKKGLTAGKTDDNRISTSYIHLSDDSDEELSKIQSNDDITVIIDDDNVNLSINEQHNSSKDIVSASTKSNENNLLLVPNLNIHVPATKLREFSKEIPQTNITTKNTPVTVKVENDVDNSSNTTNNYPASRKVRKKTTDVVKKSDALPNGLSLFKLQDRSSKETLGVLVNIKNSMKTSEITAQISKKVDEYFNDTTQKDQSIIDSDKNEYINDEYYNIINKKREMTKVNDSANDDLLRKLLDSSVTNPLSSHDHCQESNDEEKDKGENNQTSIDPKLVMDARIYLQKLDEVDSYNKNRRVNYSINTKRISNIGYRMLNYKRKSDDPTCIQYDIKPNVAVTKKKSHHVYQSIATKRPRKNSDDKLSSYNQNVAAANIPVKLRKDLSVDEISNQEYTRKNVSGKCNIVQRIKFETDDDITTDIEQNTFENNNKDAEINNKDVDATQNVDISNTSINAHLNVQITNALPDTDINNFRLTTDITNSNRGSDAMELDDIVDNTLLLDSSNSNIIKESQQKETDNIDCEQNKESRDNSNNKKDINLDNKEINNLDTDTNKLIKIEIEPKSNDNIKTQISIKFEEINTNERVSENKLIEKYESCSDNDIDLKTVKIHKDVGTNDEALDDDSKTPVNIVQDMMRLCKPVKISLKRVKIQTDNIKVRKVELPDRSSLKRRRAPTAHVAPISITLPLKCDTEAEETSDADIGTLLHQLSVETASEWQRLEGSVKNSCQVKRTRLQDSSCALEKEKERILTRRVNKKKKPVIEVSKGNTPDADDLRLQNKEWQRQKTMNNRFFDLTPKYTRPNTDQAQDGRINKDKHGNRRESISNKSEGDKIHRSETDLAVKTLIDATNNDNASAETQESYEVITIDSIWTKAAKKKLANSLFFPQKDVSNKLMPLFTKVEKKQDYLMPIATEVVKKDIPILSLLKKHRLNTEVKSGRPRSHILPDRCNLNLLYNNDETNTNSQIIPSTSRDIITKNPRSLLKSLDNQPVLYFSEDSGDSLGFETAVEEDNSNTVYETACDESETNSCVIDVKQTQSRLTSVKKLKNKTDTPLETITLTDSDSETRPDCLNNKISKSETENEIINPSTSPNSINPPIKVIENALRKLGSKNGLELMESVNAGVRKDSKDQDVPQIKNVVSVTSVIDVDDSSDEINNDKREPQADIVDKVDSIAPKLVTPVLTVTGLMPQITNVTSMAIEEPDDVDAKNEYSQGNIITELMPKICNVASMAPSKSVEISPIDDSKSDTKPINSEDEFDSDCDNLCIDENLSFNEDEENKELEKEDSSPNKSSVEIISQNKHTASFIQSKLETNNVKITENLPIEVTTETIVMNNIAIEESYPLLSNPDIISREILSINTIITSIDQNNDEDALGNNRNSKSSDNKIISNENVISDCSDSSKIDAYDFANTESKTDEHINNTPDIDENDKIAASNSDSEEQLNINSAKSNLRTYQGKKEVNVDGKNDASGNSKPRPFLKLVPIQKLLDETKVADTTADEEEIKKPENKWGDEKTENDVNSDTLGVKMRGEAIPFVCSSKTDDNTLPMISNVVSLSSVKTPVLGSANSVVPDFLETTHIITPSRPEAKIMFGEQFLRDNPPPPPPPPPPPQQPQQPRLRARDVSARAPARVADFVRDRDCTDISLLCLDLSRPVWKVYNEYLIVTNLKVPLSEPSYWSQGGRRECCRLLMDASSEGSTVVGALSVPDEVFLDNHWYRKLSTDPMIYAKVWFVVSNPKTFQEMINLDMPMSLYSILTGASIPLTILKSSTTIVKKPVHISAGDKSEGTNNEVITLDSDDE
ncbi:uncharacterized protein LOC128681442 isoform X2 [Plodia interpunctella]|uniref:uncharacterized protein LOC128681442 isoform X2 n=1 Tax=Plodia interpunctella TaxID=58824 RepID=UPI002368B1BC|nr:uncharacterized protein LOC128681442 isoform X2 [Plodia interpunctella]